MPTRSPIVEQLRLDPWDACKRLAGRKHPLFLDSAKWNDPRGRYSFLMAEPVEWIEGRSDDLGFRDPFATFSERIQSRRCETLPGLPPLQGGYAGLFGYDLCHIVEKLPRPRFDEFRTPDIAVGLYLWTLGWDHAADKCWLIVQPGGPEPKTILEWLQAPAFERPMTRKEPVRLAPQFPLEGKVTSNFDRPSYSRVIQRAIDYVHAGDCFQVNVAQRLLHPETLPPLELYRRLRDRNPAPFAAYFDMGSTVLLSASPERFLKVNDGEVETRPIKGTRPRGATPAEDAKQVRDLTTNPKDRAENVMIVDLLRNDIGKVCEYGSVVVPRVCELESFETVHHLVSEVRGRLREGKTCADLLRACFPGGSVTGAPKVRAMEIIAELEPTARGPYCGSLGYLGLDGTMDTNILIRTITAAKGHWQFPVGGGIVADSEPGKEYDETLFKAAGLLRALE